MPTKKISSSIEDIKVSSTENTTSDVLVKPKRISKVKQTDEIIIEEKPKVAKPKISKKKDCNESTHEEETVEKTSLSSKVEIAEIVAPKVKAKTKAKAKAKTKDVDSEEPESPKTKSKTIKSKVTNNKIHNETQLDNKTQLDNELDNLLALKKNQWEQLSYEIQLINEKRNSLELQQKSLIIELTEIMKKLDTELHNNIIINKSFDSSVEKVDYNNTIESSNLLKQISKSKNDQQKASASVQAKSVHINSQDNLDPNFSKGEPIKLINIDPTDSSDSESESENSPKNVNMHIHTNFTLKKPVVRESDSDSDSE